MQTNVIVYVSHGSASLVIESIRRIGEGYRFCVMENGNDKSYFEIRDFQKETGLLIDSYRIENHGFGAACNAAARFYPSSNLLYLNPDCTIFESDVEAVFLCLDSKPDSVVAPEVYDHATGYIQNYRYNWTNRWAILMIWLNLGRFRRFGKSNTHVDFIQPLWFAGSAFAINAKTLNLHNGFDENFFLYFEEEDLFRRIINSGGACIVEKAAKATHEAGTSTSENKNKIREFMLISGLHYVSKWYGFESWKKVALACKFMLITRINEIFMPSTNRATLLQRISRSSKNSHL